MIKNYFKVAFRNLKKYKGYSFINILGLAVGISVCLLIFQYVRYELSYDRYHSQADRIYRVTMDHPRSHLAVTPSMILPTSKQLFPEVNEGVRLFDAGSTRPLIISNNNESFEEHSVAYADSTLFKVFDFQLIAGDTAGALVKPKTMVISSVIAQKYFGSRNPVGQTLEVGGRATSEEYEITGVMEPIPGNSHFTFDFFISMTTLSKWGQLSDNTWKAANFYTYLVVDEGVTPRRLEEKVDRYISENYADNEFASSLNFVMEPITDIHLYSTVTEDIAPQGDIRYVLAASAIALLILIIACINYMNLATARSARRSREVGIRKVLGSDRRRLIGQFFGESAILTMLAIMVAVLLVELFLPWFSQLVGQNLSVDYTSPQFWAMILGTGLLVTLLAGSYPALMLSSFKPSSVLKSAKITGGSPRLRKVLVVFQFTASIFLIISTLVIYRQVNYIQDKDLGYKKDNVLVMTVYGDVEKRFNAFSAQLKQHRSIASAAMVSETPTDIRAGYGPDIEGIEEGPNFVATGWRANPTFNETLDIKFVAGQSFTAGDFARANQEEREYAVLVNEATAAKFSLSPDELIGRGISIGGVSGSIVGVVQNFHFSSLHRPIEPLFIFPSAGFNKLLISFNTTDVRKALSDTREVWNQMFPQYPFQYEFLDREYNALYQQEARAGAVFSSFALLAIFVACLGLVGLSSYMVEQRSREIGIRKVLGATAGQIITLFSRDFIVLVGIGFLVAVPVAWYAMSRWLQNFAYRIDMQWTVFLLAGLVTLLIALFAVGYQAVKAARLDPATSLKSE